jgi:hypothetical protein
LIHQAFDDSALADARWASQEQATRFKH